MIYQVFLDWGSGPVALHDFQGRNLIRDEGFSKTISLHRDLKPVQDKCEFTVDFAQSIANALLTLNWEQITTVQINEWNGSEWTPWFYGYIRPVTTYDIDDDRVIRIQALDNSYRLKRRPQINDRIELNTVTQLVNFILEEAGYSPFERSELPDISDVVSIFFYEDNKEWGQYVTDLLFAYGYIYYFDSSGRFRATKWLNNSITTTAVFNSSNIIKRLEVQRDDERIGLAVDPLAGTEQIVVPVYQPRTATETIGHNGGNYGISFGSPHTYSGRFGNPSEDPLFSGSRGVSNIRAEVSRRRRQSTFFVNLGSNDRTAVFTGAGQVRHGIRCDGFSANPNTRNYSITIARDQGDWAGSSFSFTLTNFVLKADVTRRVKVDEVTIDVPKGLGQLVDEYVESAPLAMEIAQGLYDRLDTAIYEYSFESEVPVSVGTYAVLQNADLNIDTVVRVIERRDHFESGVPLYSYSCEGAKEISSLIGSITGASGGFLITQDELMAIRQKVEDGLGTSGEVKQPIVGNAIQNDFEFEGELAGFAPDEDGLFFTANRLGFYDNRIQDWVAFIQNDNGVGKAKFGTGANYMEWTGTQLNVKGAATIDGTITAGDGIKSTGYISGVTGWQISGSGNAEFNAVTVRGNIQATTGAIGGFLIDGAELRDVNDRIALRPNKRRIEIKDDLGTTKIALGYLGQIADFTETQYGLYIAPGNDVLIEGDVDYANGDFAIDSDAAVVIRSGTGAEVGRFGSLSFGDIGLIIGRGVSFGALTGGGGAAGTFGDLSGGGGAGGQFFDYVLSSTVTGGGGTTSTMEPGVTGGGLASSLVSQTLHGGFGADPGQYIDPRQFGDLIGGGPSGGTGLKYSLVEDSLTLRGIVRAEQLYLYDLPTSSAGLNRGRVWVDGNTLKVAQ